MVIISKVRRQNSNLEFEEIISNLEFKEIISFVLKLDYWHARKVGYKTEHLARLASRESWLT